MNSLFHRAQFERRNSFNPEEPPPYGDFPHLSTQPLRDLEDTAVSQMATHVWIIIGIISVLAIVVACALALSTIIAFPRMEH